MQYEAVIGLEVHCQVKTQSKMFCGCANRFGAEPNTLVCPVCLGYPGSLPVANAEAVRKIVAAGLMCGCTINKFSKFDRKNYFYPDMPKNYQITQFDLPFCLGGQIPVGGKGFSGQPLPEKKIGITRIHMEEDVAKLTHLGKVSAVDYNRAGVPLMEIVSEPDMRTPDEAYAYLTALKQVLEYAGISECDMEKGQMRCDVNVSVRPVGQAAFGTKIEIKNLNSFRSAHRSLCYEIPRQIEAAENGEKMRQETRRWDDALGVTIVMRVKEHAHDYRYFPEPDLMPVTHTDEQIQAIRETLPEVPFNRRYRFITEYGITPYDAEVLTQKKDIADAFEKKIKGLNNWEQKKTIVNWFMNDIPAIIEKNNHSWEDVLPMLNSPACDLPALSGFVVDQKITGKSAKETVLPELVLYSEDYVYNTYGKKNHPISWSIIKEKGLEQVNDDSAIEGFVTQAIAANPKPVEEYKAGKTASIQFLVGQVMKLSRGKANPQAVLPLLKKHLDA